MAQAQRFQIQRYRDDFAGLCFKVIDRDDPDFCEDAMDAEQAADFADAMNSLDRYYNAEVRYDA